MTYYVGNITVKNHPPVITNLIGGMSTLPMAGLWHCFAMFWLINMDLAARVLRDVAFITFGHITLW